MIISYYNITSLRGGSKFQSLKRCFKLINPYIVIRQETMSTSTLACNYFLKMFSGWEVCSFDSRGLSSGLLSAWNPAIIDLVAFSSPAGILLEGKIRGFE